MKILKTWPLPALWAWMGAWALYLALAATGLVLAGWIAGCMLGAAAAVPLSTRWRRLFVAAGFPLSHALTGLTAATPAYAWLLPLALLALLYPLRSWRDAPLFPTPAGALRGLAAATSLPLQAQIVDAGCGLGDGLRELRREFPQARLTGWEWSRPLRLLCAWRCRDVRVLRADIWRADWSPYDLVYLFQRPESMPRAAAKAERELRPGAVLASLEFEVAEWEPHAVHRAAPDAKPVWLYRAPFRVR